MNCANSKQTQCRHCQTPYSPVPRSYSIHVHHKGDGCLVVALTSTTLGSFKLEICNQTNHFETPNRNGIGNNVIGEKIPQVVPTTLIRTSVVEPEMINNWELMKGLDDRTPFRSPNRHGSFPLNPNPIGLRMSEDDTNSASVISEFDLEVTSMFRKSLEELSPDHNKCRPQSGKENVVVYLTSLRGVWKTYEECCHVRVILRSLGVRVDERDV